MFRYKLWACVQAGSYEDLVKYLIMVRKKAKDSKVDTELVYAYAKTKQLGPLEEFISSPNQANLQVSRFMQYTMQYSMLYTIYVLWHLRTIMTTDISS